MLVQSRPLSSFEHTFFKPYFNQRVLHEARIVEGKVPFWLRRDMCAVVLGRTIYFRKDYFQEGMPEGLCLLGHELMHVAQNLHGMTIWKYIWSCRKGYMQSPYEEQAYAMGMRIALEFVPKIKQDLHREKNNAL